MKLKRISLSVSEKYILNGAYKLFICLRQFLSRLSQITIGSELISFLTSVLVHRKFTLLMGENWRMPRLFEEFDLYKQLQGYYFVFFLSNIGLKILKLWYFLWASQWVLSLYLIVRYKDVFQPSIDVTQDCKESFGKLNLSVNSETRFGYIFVSIIWKR